MVKPSFDVEDWFPVPRETKRLPYDQKNVVIQ